MSTTKTFTKLVNVWKLKAYDQKKARQGKQIKLSWSVDWWLGKYSECMKNIYTMTLKNHKVLQMEWKHRVTWHLLYRMKGENLVEDENLSKHTNYSMESVLYGIYALVVFVSETSYVNTLCTHFPWSNLYFLSQPISAIIKP